MCKIFLRTWEPTLILCVTCSWLPHSAQLVKITGELYWKQVKPYLCEVLSGNEYLPTELRKPKPVRLPRAAGRPEHAALTDNACNLWEYFLLKEFLGGRKDTWEHSNMHQPPLSFLLFLGWMTLQIHHQISLHGEHQIFSDYLSRALSTWLIN